MERTLKNIGIIGAGNMGQAVIRGVKAGRWGQGILVFEKNRLKSRKISKVLKVKESAGLESLIKRSKIIIICVKPQDIDDLLGEMAGFELKGKLIISIAAGVTTGYILKRLKTKIAVIRIMPNINAFVQESVNAICPGKHASKKDVFLTRKIFAALGENFVVSERKMDIITAVSGSGPAYAALFLKALLSAAKRNGLSAEQAGQIIYQTVRGTLTMLVEQKIKPSRFIKKVKSKGGTTEAAFKIFKKNDFEFIILKAVEAAKKRSVELGRK